MIFDRQLLYWGREKQRKLSETVVLIAGVGGLGSFVSQILIRAGVGKIYIVDRGIVDEPDLNRQILYNKSDIGKKKVFVAAERLRIIHDFTEIIPVFKTIDRTFEIPEDVKFVVDCLDNFESRKILNTVIPHGIVEIHIAVERNYGQIITFIKGISPDLAALEERYFRYDKTIPISADSVGVIASLGANEVINCIAGECKLIGTMLFVDLGSLVFKRIKLE